MKLLPPVKIMNFFLFKPKMFETDYLISYQNVILIYMFDSVFYMSVHIHSYLKECYYYKCKNV